MGNKTVRKVAIIVSAAILLVVGCWMLSPIFITREVSESFESIQGAVALSTEEKGVSEKISEVGVSSSGVTHEESGKSALTSFRSENPRLNFTFEYPVFLPLIEYQIPPDADWNSTENPSYTAVLFEKNFSINVIKGFSSIE